MWCSGMNGWHKGMEIFPKSLAVINAMSTPTILRGIPFFRYLPTKKNREIWRIEKEIHSTSKDLLQMVIKGSINGDLGPSAADQFIANNCKGICILASEVTAVATIWGLILLASPPGWQNHIGTEGLEVCKDGILNFDMFHKMKVACNSMIRGSVNYHEMF